MRKFILLLFTVTFCLISYEVFTNAGGPVSGVTGEPPFNETCATATCHTGSALNSGGGTATIVCKDSLNAVVTSYMPNHTYTITLSITEGSKTRYGFAAAVKRGTGGTSSNVGTIVITDAVKTQFFQNNVMHKSAGIDFSGTTASWSFDWKAPSGNFGTATVYAAFNATNNDQNSGGDKIYTKTLILEGIGISGISAPNNLNIARIYPNPASSQLTFELQSPATITIYNLQGEQVKNIYSSSLVAKVNIDDLPGGIYIAKVASENEVGTYKFIKQ